MTTYILVWALLMFTALAAAYRPRWEGHCSFIAATLLALFAGLRYQTGPDWAGYDFYFDSIGNFTELACADRLSAKFEPLYLALNYLVKSFGGNMPLVYLMIACFNMFVLHTVLDRLKTERMPVWLAYFGLAYLLGSFTLLRQGIAASMALLAYMEIVRSRPWRSAAWVGVSLGFQVTTVMYIPPLLLRRYWLPVRYAAALVAVCMIPVLFDLNLYVILIKFLAPYVPKWLSFKFAFALFQPVAKIGPTALVLILFHLTILGIFYFATTAEEKRDPVLRIALWSTLSLLCLHLTFFAVPSFWNRLMLVTVPWQLAAAFRLGFVRAIYYRFRLALILAAGVLALGTTCVMLTRPNTMTLVPYQSVLQVIFLHDYGDGEERFVQSLVNAQKEVDDVSPTEKKERTAFFLKYAPDSDGPKKPTDNPLIKLLYKGKVATSGHAEPDDEPVPDCLAPYKFWK